MHLFSLASQENKISQMVEGRPSFGHFGLTNATANQLETWIQMKTQIAGDMPSPRSYHAIEVIVRSWLCWRCNGIKHDPGECTHIYTLPV